MNIEEHIKEKCELYIKANQARFNGLDNLRGWVMKIQSKIRWRWKCKRKDNIKDMRWFGLWIPFEEPFTKELRKLTEWRLMYKMYDNIKKDKIHTMYMTWFKLKGYFEFLMQKLQYSIQWRSISHTIPHISPM